MMRADASLARQRGTIAAIWPDLSSLRCVLNEKAADSAFVSISTIGRIDAPYLRFRVRFLRRFDAAPTHDCTLFDARYSCIRRKKASVADGLSLVARSLSHSHASASPSGGLRRRVTSGASLGGVFHLAFGSGLACSLRCASRCSFRSSSQIFPIVRQLMVDAVKDSWN